jgi:hypothetical protein
MRARREYARGAQARRIALRLSLLGVVAVVGGVSVSGCGTATISAGSAGRTGAANGYDVLLVPEANAGWVGWCVLPVGVSGGACGNGDQHPPVIEEQWSGSDQRRESVGVAVTTDKVARVAIGEGSYGDARLLGGKSVPTRSERGLPAGLRVVLARIAGTDLLGSHSGPPHFIPLRSDGAVIPQAAGEAGSQLMLPVPTRAASTLAGVSAGICQIKIEGRSADLSMSGATVITEAHSYSGFVGTGFITCASASFEFAGWPLRVSVLISAAHPGAQPPALPAMTPLPGHSGVFSVPGGGQSASESEQYARRVPGGWLVVGKAKPAQRLALLERLRAVVRVGWGARHA